MTLKRLCAWAAVAACLLFLSTPASASIRDYVHGCNTPRSSIQSYVFGCGFTIVGTPPSTGTVGTPYSFTPTASGGTTPYAFALTGTKPPGVNFSTSTGALSGTPTTAGTYSGLSISVTDSASHNASLQANPFTITISSGGGGSPGTLDLSHPTAVTGLISIF